MIRVEAAGDKGSESATEKDSLNRKSFESDSLDELLNNSHEEAPTVQPQHSEDLQATVPNPSQDFSDLKKEELKRSRQSMPPSQSAKERRPGNSVGKREESKDKNKDSVRQGRPGQWQSARSKQQKVILLGVILGVGVLLTGGSLAYYFLTRPASSGVVADASGGQAEDVTEVGNGGTEVVDDQSDPNSRDSDQGTRDPDTGAAGPESTNDANPEKTETGTGADNVTNSDDGTPTLIPEGDPSDNDAASQNPTENQDGPPSLVVPPSEQTFEQAINQIFQDDDIFQADVLNPPSGDSVDVGDSPFGQVNIDDQSIQRRQSARVQRPTPRLVDVAKQLEMQIAGLNNDAATLPQLIAVLEQLSSVPIWIEPLAFRSQPVSLEQAKPIRAIKKNVEEILGLYLEGEPLEIERHLVVSDNPAALGLRIVPNGATQVVTRKYASPFGQSDPLLLESEAPAVVEAATPSEAQPDDPLGNRQPVEPRQPAQEDVAKPEADPAIVEIAEVVRQYVPAAWSDPAEAGRLDDPASGTHMVVQGNTLTVTADPSQQFAVQRLLEQLQAVHRTKGQPGAARVLTPLAATNDGLLNLPIVLDFYTATPLRKVLNGFAQQSGVQVIIDWPALILEGWTPDTEVPWAVQNVPAGKALEEFTFDMGLTYRTVAPGVVCLTSKTAENGAMDVEVYPVGDLLTKLDQWNLLRSRLGQLLYVEFRDYPACYLNYYPEWNCVIARLPQKGHQRLGKYFEEVREVLTQDP